MNPLRAGFRATLQSPSASSRRPLQVAPWPTGSPRQSPLSLLLSAARGGYRYLASDLCAGVAQLAEQLICNQQVAGSSPIASSSPPVRRKGGATVWQEALGRERLSSDESGKCERAKVPTAPIAAEQSAAANRKTLEGCPSGQWEQTVNLPAYAYGGSNPPPSTLNRCARFRFAAGIAQLAERQPSKLNVAGSNPVSRSQADQSPLWTGFAGRQFTNPRSSARLLRPRERGERSSMPLTPPEFIGERQRAGRIERAEGQGGIARPKSPGRKCASCATVPM